MILSIGGVYTGTLTALDTYKATSELENAEQAMFILSDSTHDIANQETPSRAVEFKVSDGRLETTQRYNYSISVDGTTISGSARGVAYHATAGKVLYEHGAVIRDQENGAVMVDKPPFKFSDEQTIVQTVDLQGQTAFRGTGVPLLVLDYDEARSSTTYYAPSGSPHSVTISINTSSSRSAVWKNYFEDQPQLTQEKYDPAAGEIEYSLETDSMLIKEHKIGATIEE